METFLTVAKQARIVIKGNEDAKKVIIALHGYGQLATYFSRKLAFLENEWKIVVPEGLHRFYLNGHSGRVGASWMTKEAREQDLIDNFSFLEQVVKKYRTEDVEELVLLGFSQGGATAIRQFYQSKFHIDKLIVWASVFPPDLQVDQAVDESKLHLSKVFVLGSADPFYSQEQQEQVCQFFLTKGYSVKRFEGNHDIDQKTLEDIL